MVQVRDGGWEDASAMDARGGASDGTLNQIFFLY